MDNVVKSPAAASPPETGGESITEPRAGGARQDGWPDFTDLLRTAREGVAGGLREFNSHLKVALAVQEFTTSIDRLHDPYLEPGSTKIAAGLGQALISGDTKAVQRILDEHKDSDSWDSVVEELGEQLEDLGVFLKWNEDSSTLQLLRPPSLWLKGPAGLSLEFKAGAQDPKVFEVKSKDQRPLGSTEIWDMKPVKTSPADAGLDLAKSTQAILTTRREGIDLAKKTIALRTLPDLLPINPAFELEQRKGAGNPNALKPPELTPEEKKAEAEAEAAEKEAAKLADRTEKLVTALLDKNLSQLVRAVKGTRTDNELNALAEELNSQLEQIGMYAEAEDGVLEFGILAKGSADGFTIIVGRSKDFTPRAVTGNSKDFQEQNQLQRPALLVLERPTRQISPQKALRQILGSVAFEENLRKK